MSLALDDPQSLAVRRAGRDEAGAGDGKAAAAPQPRRLDRLRPDAHAAVLELHAGELAALLEFAQPRDYPEGLALLPVAQEDADL